MGKKYILVTGASSGIGAQSAITLSKSHNVILCGRNVGRLTNIREKCATGSHLILPLDFTNPEETEKSLVTFLQDKGITISYLANCAGMIEYLPVKNLNPTAFENIFRVNVFSPAMIVKVLSSKKFNNKALESVVFVSSNISNFGAIAHSLYSSSKSALDGLMRSLAMELAPICRVNSVLPGGIHTPMTDSIFHDAETKEKLMKNYPLGEGFTQDIANAIDFLISEKSRWITGQQLTVDGGRTINLSV